MIPVLYEGDETRFISNGLGRLSDCISCSVTEQRNGIYELELTYPETGIHAKDIKKGRIILSAHQDGDDLQPFDIYRISKPLDGIFTVNAHHISYRLSKSTVLPFTAGSAAETISSLPAHIVPETPFTFWTDKSVVKEYNLQVPTSARSVLGGAEGSILSVFGKGEYLFNRFEVRLYLNRGENAGVTIRYGKNLAALEDVTDESDIFSGVVPFWSSPETGELVLLPEPVVYRAGVDTIGGILTVGGLLFKHGTEYLEVLKNRYKKIKPLFLNFVNNL